MLKLLKKEFKLAMHPSTIIFICFAPMLLIPDYFYAVVFFYATMGVFFTCLQGRENNDIVFSLMLPVSKKDIVKARFLYTVIIEMLVIAACIPFAVISQINGMTTAAGFDAGISLFASAFLFYAVFNAVFFANYYKNTGKVGIAFVIASIASFAVSFVLMIMTHALPFFKDVLDTPDNMFIAEKIIFLAVSVLVFAAATVVSLKISQKNFEKRDI